MNNRLLLLTAASFFLALPGQAQAPRKSQLGEVSQMIGTTRIDVTYRRPVARGRNLFGGIVPFGKEWTPSADSAALFVTSGDLEIEGSVLKAGRYAVWMIPERVDWTIIFSSAAPVFHIPYPAGRDVLRVKARSRQADHVETLAFYFPMVDADSAVLNMHWGRTVLPVRIKAR